MQGAAPATYDTEPMGVATSYASGLRPGPMGTGEFPSSDEDTAVEPLAPASTRDVLALRAMEAEWITATLYRAGFHQVPASHDPAVSGIACQLSFSCVTLLGAILTVEYHPTQRALHLLVADSFGGVARMVLFYKDKLGEVLKALVDHHQGIAMDRLVARLAPLVQVCPQTWWVGPRGALVRVQPQ